jgi:hypothetical protein
MAAPPNPAGDPLPPASSPSTPPPVLDLPAFRPGADLSHVRSAVAELLAVLEEYLGWAGAYREGSPGRMTREKATTGARWWCRSQVQSLDVERHLEALGITPFALTSESIGSPDPIFPPGHHPVLLVYEWLLDMREGGMIDWGKAAPQGSVWRHDFDKVHLPKLRTRRDQLRIALSELQQQDQPPNEKRSKRSHSPGAARDKIIGALTKHYQYSDGSCLNQDPISERALHRELHISTSTVHKFFEKEFGEEGGQVSGHQRYITICQDVRRLIVSLKVLRGEFSPSLLFGGTPPNEGSPDED